jgi:hypothetical protein
MPAISNQQQNPICPRCQSAYTVRKGKRRNRLQTLQLFQCAECEHKFTASPGRNRTYPLKLILDAISAFNLGNSMTDTQRILRERSHIDIPVGTIRSWLQAHKLFTTYSRLRDAGRKLFLPEKLVVSQTFEHKQVYRFSLHQAKLQLLLQSPPHEHLSPVTRYLGSLGEDFPHHLFRSSEHRSSTFPATIQPEVTRKENHATRLAGLALPTAPTNKKRHETLQRFMLINDSVTVAVEIPVYLTKADIAYYRSRGFDLPFETDIVTGHIDFLQIRNGYLHILDYKPEARKEKHAHVQLTIYALALSRRANLPLKDFKCAWFDEKDYFEFFPLKAVYRPAAKVPNN